MRILWIGYGQAGGKLANTLMGMNQKSYRGIAVNTENADLAGLKKVNDSVVIGKYKQKGRGVGADLDLGAEIAQKSLSLMIFRALPVSSNTAALPVICDVRKLPCVHLQR